MYLYTLSPAYHVLAQYRSYNSRTLNPQPLQPSSNLNAPRMGNRTRLDTSQVLPQRARHRAHAVWASGEVQVLAQVPDAVDGADDGRSARPEELDERALLCGVTYKRKYTLKGTVNDVKDMRELLIKQYNYPPHCIRVLTGGFT